MTKTQTVCKHEAGRFTPVVDFKRCEGKADCIRVCPYQVFELQPIKSEDRSSLNFLQRFKLAVHGGKVAYAVNADQCHACGDCVAACPENAITLAKIMPM